MRIIGVSEETMVRVRLVDAPQYMGSSYRTAILPDSACITYRPPELVTRKGGETVVRDDGVSVILSGHIVKKNGDPGKNRAEHPCHEWRGSPRPEWVRQLIEDVRPVSHSVDEERNPDDFVRIEDGYINRTYRKFDWTPPASAVVDLDKEMRRG